MGNCQAACGVRDLRRKEEKQSAHRVTTELAEFEKEGVNESIRAIVEESTRSLGVCHSSTNVQHECHHLIEGNPEQDYTYHKSLGKGSFGSVWLGKKKEGDEWISRAIKTLDLSSDDYELHALACIALEVKTMRRIEAHANVVHIHDCYMTDGKFHMVLDYCAGGEMFARIAAKSHYSEQDARFAFAQITEAVGHCHAHGVVHRDLKPENILYVAPEGEPGGDVLKVCDFGLSTVFKGHELRRVVGTPGYGAPEILNADKRHRYGEESDLWSMGCILYVMISGLMPFWGADTQEVLDRTCLGTYPIGDGPEWAHVSADCQDLIKHLLTVDPAARATCEDVFASRWISSDHRAHDVHLAHFCANLKRYELKRKFKAAVYAIIAERHLLKLIGNKKLPWHKVGALKHACEDPAIPEDSAIPLASEDPAMRTRGSSLSEVPTLPTETQSSGTTPPGPELDVSFLGNKPSLAPTREEAAAEPEDCSKEAC